MTLLATDEGKRDTDLLLGFTAHTRKGRRLLLDGSRTEKSEGMLVERGVEVLARPGALAWDRAAGIAHLTPPAPFQGSAEFRRRPHGRPIWRGSLRMPLLGGGTVRLTGRRFKATLGPGSSLG